MKITNVSIIVAVSDNNVIGVDKKTPWNIEEDLKYFRNITINKPVIMGRKTHESIGKKLPGRPNIVITRNDDYTPLSKFIDVRSDFNKAVKAYSNYDEIMVIGGAEIYKLALPTANKMYMTIVHAHVSGDTFFPQFDLSEWNVVNRKMTQNTYYTYSFNEMERV